MGVLGLILDPGGSLKQHQHVIFDPGGSLKQPQPVKKVRYALENAGLKRVILTIFGCVLGVLGLTLDPGGSLKQHQHVILDPGGR